MSKRKKDAITIIIIAALLITSVAFVAPMVQKTNKEIPFGQEFESIDELASRLNVSVEIFNAYLNSIDLTYEDYASYLDSIRLTPEQLIAEMRENTGYDFVDYIQVTTLINTKTLPDEKIYDKIATGGTTVSETADADVYINKNSLKNLSDNNITISPTTAGDEETIKLFHLFALLSYVNGDVSAFISGANGVFECEAVELTTTNVYASYGAKKPDNYNKMIDNLFIIKNEEIYKIVAMPILTLKYSDETKNISFGVIDSLGLIFTSKNVEVLKKMNDIEFFDMNIRQLQPEY